MVVLLFKIVLFTSVANNSLIILMYKNLLFLFKEQFQQLSLLVTTVTGTRISLKNNSMTSRIINSRFFCNFASVLNTHKLRSHNEFFAKDRFMI